MFFKPSRTAVTESEEERHSSVRCLRGIFPAGLLFSFPEIWEQEKRPGPGVLRGPRLQKSAKPFLHSVNHYSAGNRRSFIQTLQAGVRMSMISTSGRRLRRDGSFRRMGRKGPVFFWAALWKVQISSLIFSGFRNAANSTFLLSTPKGRTSFPNLADHRGGHSE